MQDIGANAAATQMRGANAVSTDMRGANAVGTDVRGANAVSTGVVCGSAEGTLWGVVSGGAGFAHLAAGAPFLAGWSAKKILKNKNKINKINKNKIIK